MVLTPDDARVTFMDEAVLCRDRIVGASTEGLMAVATTCRTSGATACGGTGGGCKESAPGAFLVCLEVSPGQEAGGQWAPLFGPRWAVASARQSLERLLPYGTRDPFAFTSQWALSSSPV